MPLNIIQFSVDFVQHTFQLRTAQCVSYNANNFRCIQWIRNRHKVPTKGMCYYIYIFLCTCSYNSTGSDPLFVVRYWRSQNVYYDAFYTYTWHIVLYVFLTSILSGQRRNNPIPNLDGTKPYKHELKPYKFYYVSYYMVYLHCQREGNIDKSAKTLYSYTIRFFFPTRSNQL